MALLPSLFYDGEYNSALTCGMLWTAATPSTTILRGSMCPSLPPPLMILK